MVEMIDFYSNLSRSHLHTQAIWRYLSDGLLHELLHPIEGQRPKALRLTNRCSPFRNTAPNSLSAAELHHLPAFITGVAVQNCAGSAAPHVSFSQTVDPAARPEAGEDHCVAQAHQ
jgi:hypothetical protein